MGTKAMSSQGGVGGANQQSQFHTLHTFTPNEVQNQLSEPLHNMNLDGYLQSDEPGVLEITSSQFASGSGHPHRRGVALTSALSNISSNSRRPVYEKQPVVGEMTLEDYLGKAGGFADGAENPTEVIGNVGSGANTGRMAGAQSCTQGVHWLQQQSQMGGLVSMQLTSSCPMAGALSDTQAPRRKRVAPGEVAERIVERRQKRMIKNRESAARSRARKQAYTNELENKVSLLEEENERLKKQKELDTILHSVPQPEPMSRLRRITSAPF